MRNILTIVPLFALLFISGCTSVNLNTLPSQCPYPNESMCYNVSSQSEKCISEYVFSPLKRYNLEKISISFEQIKCGTVHYANRQDIEATIRLNNQTGRISYSGSGGGSSGDLNEHTNITIPNYKSENKELFILISNALCDYFNECSECKINFNGCKDKTFPETHQDGALSFIIVYSRLRAVNPSTGIMDNFNVSLELNYEIR